jgi:hypothetical protein
MGQTSFSNIRNRKRRVIPIMTCDHRCKLRQFIKKSDKIIDEKIIIPFSPKHQPPFSLRNGLEKNAWNKLQSLFQTSNQHYLRNSSSPRTKQYFQKRISHKISKEILKNEIGELIRYGRNLFGLSSIDDEDDC